MIDGGGVLLAFDYGHTLEHAAVKNPTARQERVHIEELHGGDFFKCSQSACVFARLGANLTGDPEQRAEARARQYRELRRLARGWGIGGH